MRAGMTQKQSIAIALSKQRQMKKMRGMWRGGYAQGGEVAADHQADDMHVVNHTNTSGEPGTDGWPDNETVRPGPSGVDYGDGSGEDFSDDLYDDNAPNFAADFYQAVKQRQRRFGG